MWEAQSSVCLAYVVLQVAVVLKFPRAASDPFTSYTAAANADPGSDADLVSLRELLHSSYFGPVVIQDECCAIAPRRVLWAEQKRGLIDLRKVPSRSVERPPSSIYVTLPTPWCGERSPVYTCRPCASRLVS